MKSRKLDKNFLYDFKKNLSSYNKLFHDYWVRFKPEKKSACPFFNQIRWKGLPNFNDPLLICGLELLQIGYKNANDMTHYINGNQYLGLSIENYVGLFQAGGRGKKHCYQATIRQLKDNTTIYGTWISSQTHSGFYNEVEDYSDVSVRSIFIILFVDSPNNADVRTCKQYGCEKPDLILLAAPLVTDVIPIEDLYENSPSLKSSTLTERLSSIEIDLVFDFAYHLSFWLISPQKNKLLRVHEKEKLLRRKDELGAELEPILKELTSNKISLRSMTEEYFSLRIMMKEEIAQLSANLRIQKSKLAEINDKITKLENEVRRLHGLRLKMLNQRKDPAVDPGNLESQIEHIQRQEKQLPQKLVALRLTLPEHQQLVESHQMVVSRKTSEVHSFLHAKRDTMKNQVRIIRDLRSKVKEYGRELKSVSAQLDLY